MQSQHDSTPPTEQQALDGLRAALVRAADQVAETRAELEAVLDALPDGEPIVVDGALRRLQGLWSAMDRKLNVRALAHFVWVSPYREEDHAAPSEAVDLRRHVGRHHGTVAPRNKVNLSRQRVQETRSEAREMPCSVRSDSAT